jgi:phosphoribosylaminoimidazole (AIR) synthetase
MWRTFNMGIGMVAVVPDETARAVTSLDGHAVHRIGRVVPARGAERVRLQ